MLNESERYRVTTQGLCDEIFVQTCLDQNLVYNANGPLDFPTIFSSMMHVHTISIVKILKKYQCHICIICCWSFYTSQNMSLFINRQRLNWSRTTCINSEFVIKAASLGHLLYISVNKCAKTVKNIYSQTLRFITCCEVIESTCLRKLGFLQDENLKIL